jgi:hypothetical protein
MEPLADLGGVTRRAAHVGRPQTGDNDSLHPQPNQSAPTTRIVLHRERKVYRRDGCLLRGTLLHNGSVDRRRMSLVATAASVAATLAGGVGQAAPVRANVSPLR